MKNVSRLWAWIPICILLMGAGTPKTRLTELKKELSEKRSALKMLDEKERSLLMIISELDQSFDKLKTAYEEALVEEEKWNTQLQGAERKLQEEEAREILLEKKLRQRLRAAYVLGEKARMRFWSEQNSSSRGRLYREHLLERMSKNDLRLIAQHRTTQGEIRRVRDTLSRERQRAMENRRLVQEEKELMEATLEERQAAIQQIEDRKELGVRAVREIVREQRSVGRLIWQLRKESPVKKRGKGILKKGISWPVTGTLIKRFGTIRERGTGARLVSNGIHIRAAAGKRVAAIGRGRIAHVGWMKGFGKMVIIDHGEGHHSLYAHLSKTYVTQDQRIKAGQPLGDVGDTGSLNGAKLYFELRAAGKPIDPIPHLNR